MKIAVLVYGMYREFDIAIKSWDFLNKFNCDIYFSTWNKSKQKNNNLGIEINEDVTEERIKNHIPDATISILNGDDFNTLRNPEKMIFHWKKCLEMVEYSGNKYDFLILTRPDNYTIFKPTNEDVDKILNKNIIYGLEKINTNNDDLFIQDIFFFGEYETMSNLIKKMPNKIDINDHGGSIHYHLSKHILNNNLIVNPLPFLQVVTVRANARELENINVQSIFEKTMIWGDNQKQYNEDNT